MGNKNSTNQQRPKILKLIDSNKKSKVVYRQFYEKLIGLPEDQPVDIIMNTNGGEATWCLKICQCIQVRSGEVRVFVKNRAHSAGAIICLCASKLYITQYTSLSAIDPQIFPLKDLLMTSIKNLSNIIKDPIEHLQKIMDGRNCYWKEDIIKYLNKEQHNVDSIIDNMYDQVPDHSKLFFPKELSEFGVSYQLWDGINVIYD